MPLPVVGKLAFWRLAGLVAVGGLMLLAYAAGTTPWGKATFRRVFWHMAIVPLETRFERAEIADPSSVAGVIVLGGGDERLVEAGRLARRWPHLKIVVSGAGEAPEVLSTLGPGIDAGRVVVETASKTTFDNAINSTKLVAALGGERWLLITSAVHMPRSIGAFRKEGLYPEAWPVYDLPAGSWQAAVQVRHEWLGLGWYWLLARLDSPFPGPRLAS